MEEVPLNLILGMDLGVFIAWFGTLLAAVLCILYGIYTQLIKKTGEQQVKQKEDEKKQQEDT
jgi:hypothetical protein